MQGVEGKYPKPERWQIDALKIILSPDCTEEERVGAIKYKSEGPPPIEIFPRPSARDAPLQGEMLPLPGSSQSSLV